MVPSLAGRRWLSHDHANLAGKDRGMRLGVWIVPWLLALAGLVVGLVSTDFVIWPLVLAWLVVLALAWLFGGAMVATRSHRVTVALLLLPVLLVLAGEGGWWLIPADLAWLAIETADRGHHRSPGDAPA
jgi:hypothetical protein